jgi:ribonucleotide monophosphatase NagD (HAD superfamily)
MYNSDLEEDYSSVIPVAKKLKKIKKNNWPGAIIVLDLDGTLIDQHNSAYPNAKKFIINLQNLTKDVYICLWTMGNDVHCEKAIEDHFSTIAFNDIRCGAYCDLEGKPITVVRKYVNNPRAFIGPTIIIDDLDTNLNPTQYDIIKDVKKYYKAQTNGKIIVDYKQLFQDLTVDFQHWGNVDSNN